ncbi:MAG: 2-oxo acid dehydrogenase subunit E2 [Lachnospiraceae bacterium]|nr:2-oxo acid dehydrogenase subunit E2 [Lachnospiraceae bacterium]
MAEIIVMPKLGYTQDEGTISEWLKKEGDTISNGEPFFDVQTDKSIITVEASCSGTVLKIALEPGVTVPVLTPVAVVGQPGEDAEAALAGHVTQTAADKHEDSLFEDEEEAPAETPAAAEAPAEELKLTPRAKTYVKENNIDPASLTQIQGTGFEGGITSRDIKASPLARKVAEKLGVDLAAAPGSGIGGKVMKADVEKAAANAFAGTDELQVLSSTPYKGVRKIIGDKLSQSKFTMPHLYFTDSVDTTEMTKFRKALNEVADRKITVSDIIVYACAKALQKFPGINSAMVGDEIVQYRSVNVGVAVAGDNGLVVPVIKNCQIKTLTAVSEENRDLVDRAKMGRLSPAEYANPTFSISNLGMFGIENFTAIINPPCSAILSISSVIKKPVVIEVDGEDTIAIRPMMNIQLSVDHRLIDGLLAAQFTGYVKELLENPMKILL